MKKPRLIALLCAAALLVGPRPPRSWPASWTWSDFQFSPEVLKIPQKQGSSGRFRPGGPPTRPGAGRL